MPLSKTKTLIFLSTILFYTASSFSQTIFWSDNFSAPAGGANFNNAGVGWVLNSVGSGTNQWYINASTGQGCPGGGNLLHISCPGFLCTILGGPTTPLYNAASPANRNAYSPNISTIGRSNITLSFNYRSRGETNADYGLVSLSNDGGITWTDIPTRYENVSACLLATIAIPAVYENIPNFRIGFRWINNGNNLGVDPPFTIDNIALSVPSCTIPNVSAGSNTGICLGNNTLIGGSPTASGTPGPFSYSWSPAAGLNNNTISNPIATPIITTTYTVTVTDVSTGCSNNSTVTITVIDVVAGPLFHD
jgi:hypothetical protein